MQVSTLTGVIFVNLCIATGVLSLTGGEMKIKNKWDNLDKNVQKWATRLGAIATIVGILAAGGGWLISQVDNAVAVRIENQTESIQQEVQKLTEKVDTQDRETELQLTRLELMTLIANNPTNTVEIERLAHKYFKDLGGNSYMVSEYNRYCHQYHADCEIMYK